MLSTRVDTRPEAPASGAGVRPVPLPSLVLWASGLVVTVGVAMAVVGALRTGVSWDEPFHVMRLRNYLDHGWFALDWSAEVAGSSDDESNTLVYGPVAMLLLHGLAALLGLEGWGSVSTTPAAYDVRHLGVLLIGLVGTAAAAGLTRILLGSWRWALVTAATLLALPMWTGHVMFNIKDVPVATGYTLMTLSLVSMVSTAGASAGRRRWAVAGLAVGIVLMVGTRPAMATAVLVGLVVLAAGVAHSPRTDSPHPAIRDSVVGVAVAAGVLLLVYPRVFAHPQLLLHSTEQSASFRDGKDASYLYVPFHVLVQVPLLLQLLFAVGLVSAVRFVVRRWRIEPGHATRLTLVGAQVCALPLVAVAKNADLYNGLRQVLFASPAWAVIATLGLSATLTWASERGRLRLATGLAAVALVAPVADQATLFPYQYTYANAAFDATGAHIHSDYWRTSVPELLPEIPTDGQIVCGPTRSNAEGIEGIEGIDGGALVAGRYSSDSSVDCREDPLGPLSSEWTARDLPYDDALAPGSFYVIIDRDHALPGNCTRLAAVTRDRHLREIAMTYLARCQLAPAPLEAPVEFRRPESENMAPELWAYAPVGWVTRWSTSAIDAEGGSASLTFRAPADCAEQPCWLQLDADAPADLAAAVNGVPTQLSMPPASVLVRLPPGVSDAWVTFTRPSGEPLGLQVRSIRMVPSGDRQGDLR